MEQGMEAITCLSYCQIDTFHCEQSEKQSQRWEDTADCITQKYDKRQLLG